MAFVHCCTTWRRFFLCGIGLLGGALRERLLGCPSTHVTCNPDLARKHRCESGRCACQREEVFTRLHMQGACLAADASRPCTPAGRDVRVEAHIRGSSHPSQLEWPRLLIFGKGQLEEEEKDGETGRTRTPMSSLGGAMDTQSLGIRVPSSLVLGVEQRAPQVCVPPLLFSRDVTTHW